MLCSMRGFFYELVAWGLVHLEVSREQFGESFNEELWKSIENGSKTLLMRNSGSVE